MPAVARAAGGKLLGVLVCLAVGGLASQEAQAQVYGDIASRPSLFYWDGVAPAEPVPLGLAAPLVSDRPDFTEAATTVGLGVVQLEMGYTYTEDREQGVATRGHTYPELLMRVGMLAEWFEFRIGWTMGQVGQEEPIPVFANGAEDLYLGAKIALTRQEGWLPEMGLIPQMMVPTGSSELTNNTVLPGLNWVYGWDITEKFSMGGSTQGNRSLDSETGDDYLEMAQSITTGYSFTDRLGGYLEWFAFFPHGADTELPQHYLNGGGTLLLTENLQLDARVGMGLNRAADDFFTGAGLVVRF